MVFKKFSQEVRKKYEELEKNHTLYIVDVPKDNLWLEYMNAFPEGTNEITFENRVHECNSCKKFIRNVGNVVAIIDNKVVSIWDVEFDGYYGKVAEYMSNIVKSSNIINKFFIHPNVTNKRLVGGKTNVVKPDNTTLHRGKIGMTFSHFYVTVSQDLIKAETATIQSKIASKFDAYKRSCEEITLDSIDIVKDLIAGDLYTGSVDVQGLYEFETLLKGYTEAEDKDIYLWSTIDGNNRGYRRTSLGTLLLDVQTDSLEVAVNKFEKIVAPSNYKRTNAVVTPKMKEQHLKIIQDAGIEDSLYKKYATLDEVSVNDVLFVDSSVSGKMQDGIAGLMEKGVASKPYLGKVRDTISLDNFISNIVPKAKEISLLVENRHTSNLVSLISPQVVDAPNIQQWDNNSSWAYNGGISDSMRERVKSAGGDVDGILRFSIQWNEDKQDQFNDLDAHCLEPSGGCHISFQQKVCPRSTGCLDVDITRPRDNIAVENITYQSIENMLDGEYKFFVRNFSGLNTRGFRAEIEIYGVIYSFDYSNAVTSNVTVGVVTLKDGEFTLKTNLPTSKSSKEIWGIKTEKLVKVTSIMHSPNYWGDNKVGLKHTFFMLEGCKNPNAIRGLYNEHLAGRLRDIRKSIDMLAPMLMCKPSDNQISGLGFGSRKDEISLVVRGHDVSGTYKVKI